MAADYQLTLDDYLQIVRRRALLLTGLFLLVFVPTVLIAGLMPPIYQASGTILVESQQIPSELVPSTVTSFADERIQVITQRVMTRDNLFRIIEEQKLFMEDRGVATVTELVQRMRKQIEIKPVDSSFGGGRRGGSGTLAFTIAFEHPSPDVAHRVTNDLVTLFLSENARVRTEWASETTEFLSREAEQLRGELETIEERVAEYKQAHSDALPEHLGLRLAMLQRIEGEIQSVTRDLKAAREERRYLELELASARQGGGTGEPGFSPLAELERLKREYQLLALRYREAHPYRTEKRHEIDVLEAEIAAAESNEPGNPVGPPLSLRAAQIQVQIDANEARIESLIAQRESLQERLTEVEEQVLRTPQVERGFAALTRDMENTRLKFEEVRAKQVDARMAERLESESKAERFSLLEPPVMPELPVKPERKKIALMGLFLALAGSGGTVLVLESLNQRIRGAMALAHVTRKPPLVTIPYIRTSAESRRNRHKTWLTAGAMLALILGVIVLVFSLSAT